MLIAYRDFAPKLLERAALLKRAKFGSLQEAVDEANAWINGHGIDVVNVETVVLPNAYAPWEEGTEDPDLGQRGDFATSWNQFVRVWYRSKS